MKTLKLKNAPLLLAAFASFLLIVSSAACSPGGDFKKVEPLPVPGSVSSPSKPVSPASNLSLSLGEQEIKYDAVLEADPDGDGFKDRKSYYRGDLLVMTTFDSLKKGTPDLWLVYDDELYLSAEARDTGGDGKPDLFTYFDHNEKIVRVEKK